MPIFANVIQDAFGPLIKLFEAIMVFIHNSVVGGSWGLAILGLTVVVRLILFPLFVRQMRAVVELQRHMPEMKAIQEKYKDDKQRQQQEIMKFYRENKVNPLASCLPLVLQMPVFFSLYYMLRSDLKTHICGHQLVTHYNALHPHSGITSAGSLPGKYLSQTSCEQVAPHTAKFLFIPDLTNKATGWVLVVLIVVYVGTMLGQSLVSTATTDRNQRMMMIVLPLFFSFIIIGFPSGLIFYWIATNIWTMAQGYVIRRRFVPPAPPNKGTPPAKAGRGDGGTLAGDGSSAAATPALAGAAGRSSSPPPPRRKKKRSGRRR